ncbi:MAG: hypothetical protein WCK07_22150 [Betaproteobacteria bacterium]
MNVTTQQLAELLIGIARSQQAVIDAIDAQKPGFKATYLTPALDSVAKIRSTNRAPSLQEFPARVLSQCQSRGGPNLEQVMKDLEALLSGQVAVPDAVAPATLRAAAAAARAVPAPVVPAPAAASPAAASADDNDLDMTKL